jgi:hypothetical protein
VKLIYDSGADGHYIRKKIEKQQVNQYYSQLWQTEKNAVASQSHNYRSQSYLKKLGRRTRLKTSPHR